MRMLSINKSHKVKTPKQMERHFKGIANHRRIQIILLVRDKPSISLDKITEVLDANYKTMGGHISRLISSGLISRGQSGERAQYNITPYGKTFCNFIDDFMFT